MGIIIVDVQGHIMRKEERGEEHETTMHLIKIQVFTHTSCVTKFSKYEVCMYR